MDLKHRNRDLNLREAAQQTRRLRSRPMSFWLDLTGRCSLACRHCPYHIHGRTSDQEMSDTVYRRVMDEVMPSAFTCHLGGTNYGEMTIARRFHEFLRDCGKHHVKVNLTTNGTRLADEWFDNLTAALCKISFSMEGIGEQFELIRGFSWDKFLANVTRVCRAKPDRGPGFRVEWHYCTHADSIRQLPEMIRMAADLGVDRIQVMNLVPYIAGQKHKQLGYHRTLANAVFAEARALAADLRLDVSVPPDFSVGTFDKPAEPARPASRQELMLPRCHTPWQTCSINELGAVRPCATYWRPMGSIADGTFESVWNGRRYRQLRGRINRRSFRQCYHCRQPRFDSEENLASMQLAPSLKQIASAKLHSLLHPVRVTYAGAMESDHNPLAP